MNEGESQGSFKRSLVDIRTTMGITATKSRDKNSSQCAILVSQETSDFLRNSKKFICVLCCILWFALSRLAGRHGAGQMPHRDDKPGCLQLLNLEGSAGQAGVPGLICVWVKWVPPLTFQATPVLRLLLHVSHGAAPVLLFLAVFPQAWPFLISFVLGPSMAGNLSHLPWP